MNFVSLLGNTARGYSDSMSGERKSHKKNGALVSQERELIGRRSKWSYLSGMALIVSDRFELGVASEQVINFFPAVVIRVSHSFSLPYDDL